MLARAAALMASPPVLSCATYSLFSIAMVLGNKVIMTMFGFDCALLLLLFQAAFAVAMGAVLKRTNRMTFEDLQYRLAVRWLPVNILFCIMLYSGFKR
jgi:hypothetical protein